jgi:hypothetical protein
VGRGALAVGGGTLAVTDFDAGAVQEASAAAARSAR